MRTRDSIEELPKRRSARGLVAMLLVGLVALAAWTISRDAVRPSAEPSVVPVGESAEARNPEPDVRSGEPASATNEASSEGSLERAFPDDVLEDVPADVGSSGGPSAADTREAVPAGRGDDSKASTPTAKSAGQREAEARAKPRRATPPARVRQDPATVSIVVFPWGNVWIDGERIGKAPVLDRTLKPGSYVIGAGERRPTQQRTVRVRAGERRKVTFDLTPQP